jgi:hypothetical protein
VTIEIAYPFPAPATPFNAIFGIEPVFPGSSPSPFVFLVPTDDPAPFVRTFAFQSVSQVRLRLLCLETGGTCTVNGQTNEYLEPGKFFDVTWQIQDPPGDSSGLVIPWEWLLVFVAIAVVPSAAVLYFVKSRLNHSRISQHFFSSGSECSAGSVAGLPAVRAGGYFMH